MIPWHPALKYSPSRVSTGEGDYEEVLGDATNIYVIVRVHEGETFVTVHRYTGVRVRDILVIDDAQYRVIEDVGPLSAPERTLRVERVERPVHPR